MKIKKFVAPTLKEATEMMKKEFGDDAIILGTRRIKQPGIWGFLKPELIEIVGAIEENRFQESRVASYEAPKNTVDLLRRMTEEIETKQRRLDEDEKNEVFEKYNYSIIKSDLEEVKQALNQITEHLKYRNSIQYPPLLKKAFVNLLEKEVDEDLANKIVRTVLTKLSGEELKSEKIIENEIINVIADIIKFSKPVKPIRRKSFVLAFVGPTGVGKTTTVAKLAAIYKLFENAKVALISADTYRIAAIEQLQTFANIANIPMDVAYTPEDIARIIRKHQDKDIILIDTVGRNQRQTEHISELAKFIKSADPDEVHLVLSATSSYKNMIDVYNRFKALVPNRLIFSKVDEAVSLGYILNIAYKTKLPLSYITTGQNVPDDIAVAEPKVVANLIYKEVLL
ncbi:MAG: flagellar biosynthesis protein FlhF [Candidatus Kryptonium sp.]|nr:flagellar biosynthesis protein FlhF [Candidatus Kryptonium sp.]MCX7762093.1 flagellar biosynthesis protein FlhF [Candidatus Kryptonium sp.]MDW8108303.1 flagellar biosynthesis protein FlhF [Candidatus Kryptonium sp.]